MAKAKFERVGKQVQVKLGSFHILTIADFLKTLLIGICFFLLFFFERASQSVTYTWSNSCCCGLQCLAILIVCESFWTCSSLPSLQWDKQLSVFFLFFQCNHILDPKLPKHWSSHRVQSVLKLDSHFQVRRSQKHALHNPAAEIRVSWCFFFSLFHSASLICSCGQLRGDKTPTASRPALRFFWLPWSQSWGHRRAASSRLTCCWDTRWWSSWVRRNHLRSRRCGHTAASRSGTCRCGTWRPTRYTSSLDSEILWAFKEDLQGLLEDN